MIIHWKAVEQYFTVVVNFTQFVILENVLVFNLALSVVKELEDENTIQTQVTCWISGRRKFVQFHTHYYVLFQRS